MERVFNKFSSELRKKIQAAKPKPNQIIWFESLAPKRRGSRVIAIDRIFDPWARGNEQEGWEGDYVDIAYITGVNRNGHIIGEIQYTVQDFGVKGCRGGDAGTDALFEFMFLTNQNKTNKDDNNPWYVPGSKGPVFYMRKPNQNMKNEEEFRFKRQNAEKIIFELEGTRLRDYADWFDISYAKTSEDGDIKKALYRIADKDPSMITRLDKNVQFRIKTCIMAAERYGILRWDANLNRLLWAKTDSELVTIPPGTNKYVELIKYFEGKDSKSYQLIAQLVAAYEEQIKLEKQVKPYQIDNLPPTVLDKEPEPVATDNPVTLQEPKPKGRPKKQPA